jgi:hypothetical protein
MATNPRLSQAASERGWNCLIDHLKEHNRYCRSCGYLLRKLEQDACPECGRDFDPDDLRTTLRSPNWNPWKILGSVHTGFAILIGLVALAAMAMSFLAFDPLICKLITFAMSVFMLPLVIMTLIPRVEIHFRMRMIGLASVALLLSVAFTDWPLRVSFAFHRPALEVHARKFLAGETVTTPTTFGLFTVMEVKYHQGNVGYQLTGDGGGGTFLVLKDPSNEFVWINTNWEWSLGGDWFHVSQD